MPLKSKWLLTLDIISVLLLVGATLMVFFYAPLEEIMGAVQKVFYFHVSSGWVGMLAFLVAAIAGGIYLRNQRTSWDILSYSTVEIGMVFSLITILTGMLWARPVWNTWWTWDPRLTTIVVMELVYAAYILLRQAVDDPARRGRFAAVYAILGFISVPLTFFSIRQGRTIHPVLIGSSDPAVAGAFDMTPRMVQTLLVSLFAFTVLFVTLLWHRVRLGQMSEHAEQLKARLLS